MSFDNIKSYKNLLKLFTLYIIFIINFNTLRYYIKNYLIILFIIIKNYLRYYIKNLELIYC